jgi:cell volume regulation protein A
VPVVLATFPLLDDVPDSVLYFNVVFFVVLLSTLLQGTTFEAVAARLHVTTEEAALPAPFADPVAIRRLGAEIVEFEVHPGDAAAGRYVRELALPREALLNVIVRGDQAIPPRGSTRVEAGDRLHVLVRQEASVEFRDLLSRWRAGPLGPPPRPKVLPGKRVFSERPWREADGDAARPRELNGIAVVEQLRTRRDRPGAVVVLADGRVAYTGTTVAIGAAPAVQDAARRRLTSARDEADRAWWREVLGALAMP